MQTGHSSGDLAVADAQVTGNALIGQVPFDESKQLEFGTLQTAAQLGVCEAMYPGCPCHSRYLVTLWRSALVFVASSAGGGGLVT